MNKRNWRVVAASAAVFGFSLAVRASVTLTLSAGAPSTTWPVGPDGTIPHNPETTVANPSTGSVIEQPGDGRVLSETFTAGSTPFSLGAISFVGNGGQETLGLHLFAMNSTYHAATDGGYVPATAFAQPPTDLLGGGSGLSATFFGAPSDRILTFDFTDADEVVLSPNTSYAFEMWISSSTGGTLNVERTSNHATTNGGMFLGSGAGVQSATSTVSRNHPGGDVRNMIFAVYPNAASLGPKAVTWAGGSAVWDHSTTNFTKDTDQSAASFNDNDSVTFADVGVGTVTLSGSLEPGSLSFVNTGGTYVLVGTGSIDGAASLAKSGDGGLIINQANTFSGGANVNGGTLTINNAAALGSGSLGVSNNAVFVSSVDATIASLGMGANGGAVISVAAGHTVTFANGFSGGGLTLNGTGTVVASGTANTNLDLNVNGGLLAINAPFGSNIGTPVSLNAGGGSIKLGAPASATNVVTAATVNSITVGSSQTVSVAAVNRAVNKQELVIANQISIDGSGHLDLANNDAVIHFGGADQIQTYISGGLLTSSSATSITRLGVVANSNGEGGTLYATFDGTAVTSSDVLIKYTYNGDTDLNGVVDGSDLANLLAGMNGQLTGWVNGDVDGSGVINTADLNLLTAALRGQGASLGDSAGGGAGAIPEPTSSAGLVFGATGVTLIRRRRR